MLIGDKLTRSKINTVRSNNAALINGLSKINLQNKNHNPIAPEQRK